MLGRFLDDFGLLAEVMAKVLSNAVHFHMDFQVSEYDLSGAIGDLSPRTV
jgi:hypothetical protein